MIRPPPSTGARVARWWRVARISALGEVLAPWRMTAGAVRLVVQLSLVVALWRGLYATTASSAGLDRTQAVSYAALAVLASRVHASSRWASNDAVVQHLYSGTIAYWFTRPMSPARYHALRFTGEQVYGLAWALGAFAVCRVTGVISAPASPAASALFVVTAVLGQLIAYRLTLLIDLACFWTFRTDGILSIITFVQNLVAGTYAPLWFFPRWFRFVSGLLPFQLTLHSPLSVYIGRIAARDAGSVVVAQVAWLAALAGCTHLLWSKVPGRLTVQGG